MSTAVSAGAGKREKRRESKKNTPGNCECSMSTALGEKLMLSWIVVVVVRTYLLSAVFDQDGHVELH